MIKIGDKVVDVNNGQICTVVGMSWNQTEDCSWLRVKGEDGIIREDKTDSFKLVNREISMNKDMFSDLFYAAQEHPKAGNARIVAAITDGRQILYGGNSKKTHPFQKRFAKNEDCIYLHAEIDAIKNWLWLAGNVEDLRRCSMYVMRVKKESRNGPFITGLSKPCEGCMRAIATFDVGKVFYTENNASEFTCL